MHSILGLDCSSVTIGYARLIGDTVERYGCYALTDRDIAQRCYKARLWTIAALTTFQPTLVVLESPAARGNHLKGVLPQVRVSGAVLGALAERHALWEERSPACAALALTGRGTHPKGQRKVAMLRAAADLVGHVGVDIRTVRGKLCALAHHGTGILTEDEADAIGLALAGLTVRITQSAA